MKTTLIVSLLSAASSVMAHGYVQEFLIGGTRYTGSLPFSDQYKKPAPDRITQKFWENGNSFVDDVTSADIACNKGAAPAKLVAPAPAGSQITFFWTEWPESHKGPVITYLADCGGDCTTAVGSKLNWFKIDEAGLMPDGSWAASALIKNNNTWTINLPRKIKNGQYLLRHEIIALHASHEVKGSQFYPSCTNIEITGATGENTPDTVKLPGAYGAQDPGIFINIYYPPVTKYTIPGPKLYTEDGTTSPVPQEPAPENPASTDSFPTLVPSQTEGVYPTGDYPVGTGGAPTDAPVPTEAPESTSTLVEELTVTTTITTTIAGKPITLTATYCTGRDTSPETAVPEPEPVPVEPACAGEKTVTVTVTQRITDKYEVASFTSTHYSTVSLTNTHYATVTKTVGLNSQPSDAPEPVPVPEPVDETEYPSSGPVLPPVPTTSTAVAGLPTTTNTAVAGLPTTTDASVPTTTGFEIIPYPTSGQVYDTADHLFPTANPTETANPTATVTDVYEPSGTGAPLTGYESATTGADCEEAYAHCKRTFEGCMKRAKRSGMQTRSCEKFKRDVCVDGLSGCNNKVFGYGK